MARESRTTERVMQYMKNKIESGEWPVGSQIPTEHQLCAELDCSRTSVRNALKQFNVLGVIKSQHGRGSFVTSDQIFIPRADQQITGPQSLERVTDNMKEHSYWEWRQARDCLEPEIGFRVAKIATDEFVKKLEKINEELRSAVGDPERFIAKDIEFHMALAEFLGNRIITEIMRNLLSSQEMHIIGNNAFGYMGGVYYHALITDAIAKRNPEQTRALMIEHGRNNEIMRQSMSVTDEMMEKGEFPGEVVPDLPALQTEN